jgi:F-box associated region
MSIKAIGIPEKIMDDYKPVIKFSEWYAGRFDCGCVYECEVSLMDVKSKVLASYPFRAFIKQWEGGVWHKVN